ncbi:MFS general substrate transporter [Earliella scabrosa]|nr:MFS general substrate transporter [Earliella scabrosa]
MSQPGPQTVSSRLGEKVVEDAMIEEVTATGRSTQDFSYHGDDRLPPPPIFTAAEEAKLWRKIDLRFMPIITTMYLCSFLDRSNIGNAKLEGLMTQLDLTGHRYNVALTVYFVASYIFSIPINLVLKKFRPSRCLPGLTLAWGVVTTLMGLVKTYDQLVAVRVLLGITESGFVGGVFYLFSLWYPKYMLQTRIAMFFAGASCAGAFSGLLAFAISFMSGTAGLLGWSWIFIIEGLATVAVAFVAFFLLLDLPRTATFLTPEERSYITHRKKYDNSSVGEEEHFEWRHVREALSDWQVWLLSFINMTVLTAVYGISLFLPSIINGFGFNTTISQLLTVPPYFLATIAIFVCAAWADRLHMRSPVIAMGLSLCAVGYGINLSGASIGVKYFATYLVVIGAYAAFPATNSWIPNNTSGQYKRGVSIGVQVIAGNLGGLIASNVFRTEEAPNYRLGHGLELLFVGLGLILTPIAVFTYTRINARRDALLRDSNEKGIEYSTAEIRRMGDRAPDFRYTL